MDQAVTASNAYLCMGMLQLTLGNFMVFGFFQSENFLSSLPVWLPFLSLFATIYVFTCTIQLFNLAVFNYERPNTSFRFQNDVACLAFIALAFLTLLTTYFVAHYAMHGGLTFVRFWIQAISAVAVFFLEALLALHTSNICAMQMDHSQQPSSI